MGLVDNPMRWSASIVGSWLRVWLLSVFFLLIVAWIVFESANHGWRAALGPAVFLGAYQVMLLYALRRMVLAAGEQGPATLESEQRKRHFLWEIALIAGMVVFLAVMMHVGRET